MSTAIEQLPLEPTDSVASLRVKLSQLRGQRILLVWSPENDNLKRKLDLVLIQREADRNAIQLAIVAEDPRLIGHAAELNISCFDSVEAGQGARWKRSRKKVFLPRAHRPRPELQPSDLAFIAGQLQRRRSRSSWRSLLAQAIVLFLLISIVGALIYVVAPGAVVRVSLRQEQISQTVDIIADSKIEALDIERARISAQVLLESVETTVSIPASGTQWLDSVSAAGVVTFTNLTDEPVGIPRGSAISTSAGAPILFETSAEVVVPAGIGASVDATVTVIDGHTGSIGNVGAGMINSMIGDLAERVSVINLAPAAGGGNPSVKVVAARDHVQLLDIARIQLQSLAYDRMRANLAESQVIIIESLQIAEENKDWLEYSAIVGAMTSEVSLTMRAVISAIVIDEAQARQVLMARLKAAAPEGMRLLQDSFDYERGAFSLSRAKEQVRFTASAKVIVLAQLDGDALREQLAGANLDEARAILAEYSAILQQPAPRLSLHPRGLGHMPLLPIRIHIEARDEA